jgi:predicted Zn-dependent protease
MRMKYRMGVAIALAAVLVGLMPNPGRAVGLTDLFMSPEQESRVGAEEHQRVLQEFGGPYPDPELAAYVSSIGNFLVRTSAASGTKFTFTVLDSPVVNAFALPGGYVYVTRGLLALADSEAELAGVLAHEIGHVAAHHGAQRQSQNVLANLGLLVLGVATNSSAAVNLGQIGAAAVLSGYSRQDEYEADTLGV